MAALTLIVAATIGLPLAAGAGAPGPGTDTTTSTATASTITSTTVTSTTVTSTTVTTDPTTTDPEPDSATTTTTTTATTTATTVAASTPEVATTTAPVSTTTTVPAEPVEAPELDVQILPDQIEQILATIRYLESRGNYALPPNRGNASGAYQFIESTWSGYGGFQHAYLAPPSIQDERAAIDVQTFLDRFDGDVSMVPVMWYLPAAVRDPALMDLVPKPENGNVLTIREYQSRWLAVFTTISGEPVAPRQDPLVDVGAADGLAPDITPSVPGSPDAPVMSFPVLGPSRIAVPDCHDVGVASVVDRAVPALADIEAAGLCTPEAPAVVFGVKLQPVLAVTDGVVTDVRDEPGSGEPVTVTVTDLAGRSYVHAGFNDDNPGTNDGAAPRHLRLTSLAQVGVVVRAGQVIGFMGDTDPLPLNVREAVPTDGSVVIDPDGVAPHVRITAIDLDGHPIDAFGPVVDALFGQTCRVMIGQWSVPGDGGVHEPVVIETTDDDTAVDSEWIITSTDQVLASGWAAMVNPSSACADVPPEHHGPGAAGSHEWLPHWLDPYELPTATWVAAALRDTASTPVRFVG